MATRSRFARLFAGFRYDLLPPRPQAESWALPWPNLISVTQTGRLLDYRNSLGGFKSLDQLDDIVGFPRDLILELKGKLTL